MYGYLILGVLGLFFFDGVSLGHSLVDVISKLFTLIYNSELAVRSAPSLTWGDLFGVFELLAVDIVLRVVLDLAPSLEGVT